MPHKMRLWQVVNDQLTEVQGTKLNLESRLENWLAADISILGSDLLLIGRQVPTDFGGYIDLLCIDSDGDLVIVELKREKTPREITAQIIDYASWVDDLSPNRVIEIADEHLGSEGALEAAFGSRFGHDLPEILNEDHKLLIIASEIDPSSERIVTYLSSKHGVNINAVTFQYFQIDAENELLGRVFLIEPTEVEHRVSVRSGSKRRPRLTYEELEATADQNGVGEIYRYLVEGLRPLFDGTKRTRSGIGFKANWNGANSVIFSLIPTQNVSGGGLCFQLYALRAAQLFALTENEIRALLPDDSTPWAYYQNATPEWTGYTGYFEDLSEAARFVDRLKRDA